jgi:hypothetical protein
MLVFHADQLLNISSEMLSFLISDVPFILRDALNHSREMGLFISLGEAPGAAGLGGTWPWYHFLLIFHGHSQGMPHTMLSPRGPQLVGLEMSVPPGPGDLQQGALRCLVLRDIIWNFFK